ncbi:hypothetical protein TNCV_472401 [Trichonephila clavipes]|nr:hypothetical protein TNCV_472401 [Trichonephila clavipes]
MMRHYMKDRVLVMGRVGRTRENPKYLGKPRVRRKRADKEQETSMTGSGRPGQHQAKETVQLRGDQSGDSSETLSLLPTEPIKEARRNTRGAKEQWNRQSTAEQPREKEPQHGEALDGNPVDRSEKRAKQIRLYRFFFFLLSNKWSKELLQ